MDIYYMSNGLTFELSKIFYEIFRIDAKFEMTRSRK